MALDLEAKRKLAEAARCLSAGRPVETVAIARAVRAEHPDSVDAAHLLALGLKHSGELPAAVEAFRQAQALSPLDATIAGNLGNVLALLGDRKAAIDAYLKALEINPSSAEVYLNLGLALLDQGEAAKAFDAFAAGLELRKDWSALWHGLGSACRELGDLDQASMALEEAVRLDPDSVSGWISLGVVSRLRGDPGRALDCYGRARARGGNSVALLDAEASAHFDLGDTSRSLSIVNELLRHDPTYVAGQIMRVEMLYESGADRASAIVGLEQAIESNPDHDGLRIAGAQTLLAIDSPQRALEHLQRVRRRRDDPTIRSLEAEALVRIGELAAARDLLVGAPKDWLDQPLFVDALAKALLRTGDPQRAAQVIAHGLQKAPFDQSLLAMLGIAWRLLDDPREQWLCDYERMILRVDLKRDSLAELESYLRSVHRERREPLRQSLRSGTQTSGNLLGRNVPVLVQTKAAFATALKVFLETMSEDASHPFLSRKSAAVRFKGSWSVLLRQGGRHVNHFHQEGWISSAYYVALPAEMNAADELDSTVAAPGCLQFGQPPTELVAGLAPRRVIRPSPGEVVLFPSYFWHGTVPFESDDTRLTIAFDVIPAN